MQMFTSCQLTVLRLVNLPFCNPNIIKVLLNSFFIHFLVQTWVIWIRIFFFHLLIASVMLYKSVKTVVSSFKMPLVVFEYSSSSQAMRNHWSSLTSPQAQVTNNSASTLCWSHCVLQSLSVFSLSRLVCRLYCEQWEEWQHWTQKLCRRRRNA